MAAKAKCSKGKKDIRSREKKTHTEFFTGLFLQF